MTIPDCNKCATPRDGRCTQCKKSDARIFFSKTLNEYWEDRINFNGKGD